VAPLVITHFIPIVRLADGGVVRSVLDWCRLLALRGHQVTLLTCDATDVPREWLSKQAGLPYAVVLPPPDRIGRLSSTAQRVAQRFVESADTLHLHGLWLPSNHQLARMARRGGVPYVLTIHGMLDDWSTSQRWFKKRVFHGLLGRRFIQQAARVHCTAVDEQRQAAPWLGNVPVTVLPCLVDLEPYRHLAAPARAVQNSSPKLLILSRLHPQKGIDLLIDSIAELRRRHCPVQLLIAGEGEPGYEASLKMQVSRLGLDGVKFLGLVTGSDKLALFQSADLFVLPTSQENFGLALIEAAACGTPLLTTRGVDIWQELQSAGAMIADRTATAFADAIEQLLGDREQLQEKGRFAREWVFRTLDFEHLLPECEKFYESVISSRTTERVQGLAVQGSAMK
jgi:glycosyltransferase involved in cell wall biosynthesis